MDPRELFGWNRDANRAAAARARETGEDINLNAWERLMGGNVDHATNINKRKKQEDLNTQFGASAAEYGVSGADWGENRETQLGRIQRGKKKEQKAVRKDNLKDQTTLLTATQKPQIAGIEAGLEQGRLQHQATMKGMENTNNLAIAGLTQSNNQFMAQMADSKDQRAMELQMRREEMDRLDRKDERNRRKDSIAALTAGLASLGAAFAL